MSYWIYNGMNYYDRHELDDVIREELGKNHNNIDVPDEWVQQEFEDNVEEVEE